MAKNSSKLTGFTFHHIGASRMRSYEDRSFFGQLTTEGGLNLTVAIVSDGVGGGNLGQRAAQLTVDKIVEQIKNSTKSEKETPQILGSAIGAANKAVYQESKSDKDKNGMSATVSIAVVCNSKLYVANVGDSRVYLLQDGQTIKQITVDHTFVYEKIKQGVPPEKVYGHPNADAITRSVGFEPQIIVDLGLYLNGGQEDGQQAFSNQGLQIKENDVILVCSDGLIKPIRENKKQHYVEDAELVATIQQYHAEEATKVLVDLAVGRNVDDNVTAVIVEFSSRKIKSIKRQRAIIWSGVSIALLILLFFVWSQLVGVTGQRNELAQANIDGTRTSSANTAIVASFTQTPSATPRPTLVPGEVGAVFLNGNRRPFLVDMPVFEPAFAEVHVNHTGEFEDGKIYMFSQSKILFEALPAEEMKFVVFPDSQLFVYPGRYAEGAGMRLSGAKGIVDFLVSGSCMALNYSSQKVVASCYEGACSYQINYDEKISIPEGTELQLDINTLLVDAMSDIPLAQANSWLEVLPLGTHARQCVMKFIPIESTATKRNNDGGTRPSPTISPTNKPLPTNQPPTLPSPTLPPPTDTPLPVDPPTPTDEPKKTPKPTSYP